MKKKICCIKIDGTEELSFDTVEEAIKATGASKQQICFGLHKNGWRGGNYYWYYSWKYKTAYSKIWKKINQNFPKEPPFTIPRDAFEIGDTVTIVHDRKTGKILSVSGINSKTGKIFAKKA